MQFTVLLRFASSHRHDAKLDDIVEAVELVWMTLVGQRQKRGALRHVETQQARDAARRLDIRQRLPGAIAVAVKVHRDLKAVLHQTQHDSSADSFTWPVTSTERVMAVFLVTSVVVTLARWVDRYSVCRWRAGYSP